MIERTTELCSTKAYITLGSDGQPANWSRDWLNTTTYVSGEDRVRRVSMTIDTEKAQDLIELLQGYIEYRTAHPQKVRS